MIFTPFEKIAIWLTEERNNYQTRKWDYDSDDIEHIKQGTGKDTWLTQQITNYAHRASILGLENPGGRQAYMKLIATVVGLGEAMIRVYGDPPKPGYSSGATYEWKLEKRIYVSGPMSGLENKNFDEFNRVSQLVREAGFYAVNPADHGDFEGLEHEDYLRIDLQDLLTCNGILLLDGWAKSKGAGLELQLAKILDLPIFTSVEELEKHEWN